MVGAGYELRPFDPAVERWAQAACAAMQTVEPHPRRHCGTWFVGVDALPNAPDGSVAGVPMPFATMTPEWHRAQVSIVYRGYPRQDPDENDAAHRFRLNRDAAHMDGLLPEGPTKRRHLREPHQFIIGMSLNAAEVSPLVVWEGSHVIMGDAFRRAYAGIPSEAWGDVDVTEIYQDARRKVFATCPRKEVPTRVGEAVILHRHLIHGVAPWIGVGPDDGRMIAYFRPLTTYAAWAA